MSNQIQTIPITNFQGRLTRIINGDLNSGFAKFDTSWGYDPFSKPMNLTWLEQPTDITGPITDLIVDAKKFYGYGGGVNFGTTQQFVALLGNGGSTNASQKSGNLYVMQPASIQGTYNANTDSVIGIVSVSGTYSYGGSIEVYTHPSVVGITANVQMTSFYVGHDSGVTVVPATSIAGAQSTVTGNYVGTINAATGSFRKIRMFQGKLRVSNSTTILSIDSTGTIVSPYTINVRGVTNASSDFNPPLSLNSQIQDMEVSPDGNYLLLASSNIDNPELSNTSSDSINAVAGESVLYGWNGSDLTVTTSNNLPTLSVTALKTYLGNNFFFGNDPFSSAVSDGTNKLLSMVNNRAPFANAVTSNGNFITWTVPEYIQSTGKTVVALYYFGSLDQENPPGLFRLVRNSPPSGNSTFQAPMNVVVDNNTKIFNPSTSVMTAIGYGKHYFSAMYPNSSGTVYKLYRFTATPTGTGSSQIGTYETQTQLLSQKVTIKQIRVYTEPTVSGNQFQIQIIGSDGQAIDSGGMTYTFAAGTDVTTLKGSLDRIDFVPAVKPTYAIGIRVNNLGTTNWTLKKIEIDYTPAGK